jgi:5-methyltetrahydropteroyltriglutamate--homocysteine methyltransferase
VQIVRSGALVPGIYPRSEALVQATRDLARGRTTAEAVETQRRDDRECFLALQRECGLAPLSDGMLDWQDLFRPLVDASTGLGSGPLVRFLDGNTFYRSVTVDGTPRLSAPIPAPPLPEPWLGTLPSPFALSCATGGAVSAATLAETLLAPQLEAWAGGGCGLVVLAEPFLPREPGRVGELLEALGCLPRRVPVALQLAFGDAAPLLVPLAGAPVDAVGVDFYRTQLEAVPAEFPKVVLAGVVDAASSQLEDPSELAAFVQRLRARRPAGLVLTPNGDLEHVPEAIAREKLRRLGAAAAALREAA